MEPKHNAEEFKTKVFALFMFDRLPKYTKYMRNRKRQEKLDSIIFPHETW